MHKFQTKKILYNRTHPSVGEKYTFDVGSRLSWKQMFGTSSMKEVEDICKAEDAPKVSSLLFSFAYLLILIIPNASL